MENEELFEISESLAVNPHNIVAIERLDENSTVIFVKFGLEVRTFTKNVPYSTLLQIMNGRRLSGERKYIDSSASRSLEQLAKYQAIPVP